MERVWGAGGWGVGFWARGWLAGCVGKSKSAGCELRMTGLHSRSVSLGLTDYSHVDMLGLWYISGNFRAEKRLASPNW